MIYSRDKIIQKLIENANLENVFEQMKNVKPWSSGRRYTEPHIGNYYTVVDTIKTIPPLLHETKYAPII